MLCKHELWLPKSANIKTFGREIDIFEQFVVHVEILLRCSSEFYLLIEVLNEKREINTSAKVVLGELYSSLFVSQLMSIIHRCYNTGKQICI